MFMKSWVGKASSITLGTRRVKWTDVTKMVKIITMDEILKTVHQAPLCGGVLAIIIIIIFYFFLFYFIVVVVCFHHQRLVFLTRRLSAAVFKAMAMVVWCI